ncbi:Antibiotic biosynthesis monooxygenase [Methylocella silvestris BL2]|uniref:Antibiotic biosynthesis monooxygenase n=1 Tax=Methylocella silvestris (strain DSM 15510 / CIP 108128 / LMG 27833 / NCIMB 13906 / BL2) TaxID=395965 RepID=B8ENU3_METSB|nr:antibiotic biosynthesis monooxygenase [Methylocella silvestris]ACK50879.1 Antibiotic biosynthesis monooxygenase [Methylocella silvestris BL2]
MYIAMNRFKVRKGEEPAFEAVWRARESRLHEMTGFSAFHLLRGPEGEDHTLYVSHTIWDSHADFVAWTKSEQFRDAHKDAGKGPSLTIGHPVFEGFEAVELADVTA